MTNSEAIKFAEEQKGIFGGKMNEFLDTAIQALEKQIPKHPDYEGDGYYDGEPVYDTWICPCCEKRYELEYDNYDYCPNCGQKLDWGDE